MRNKKIAILAVQETHMDEQCREAVENIFGRRLHIVASTDSENPSQRAGIALVLNKSFVNVSTETTKVIHEGRAILTSINWGAEKTLTVLAVYAPNLLEENVEFWKKIREFFELHPRTRKPDIMLGDFNMVEDTIDRNPSHNDSLQQTQELADLKSSLRLQDGWRQTYPDKRSFTFMQPILNGGAKSRIDRIYVTSQLLKKSSEWHTNHSGLANTDHLLVSAQITNAEAPVQGDGRWCLPERVVEDKAFRGKAKELIKAAWEQMTNARATPWTDQSNAQAIYAELKFNILDRARCQDKIMTPKILRDIGTLRKDLQQIDGSQDPSEVMTARLIADKIADLEKKRHNKIRELGRVKNRLEGEMNSRYWMQINKELKPRDMIFSLKNPNIAEAAAETVSKKMAEVARKYHNELQ
ncbi:DNase I-like protein, partial [Pleurotus eryngii]